MEKKIVIETIKTEIDFEEKEYDINELILMLQRIRSSYSKYDKITFKLDLAEEPYMCNPTYTLETKWKGYRDETDEELEKREIEAMKHKETARKRKETMKKNKELEIREFVKKNKDEIKKIMDEHQPMELMPGSGSL